MRWLALLPLLVATPAMAAPLDGRAPDLNAPVARTLPPGTHELGFGLGAAFGARAPMPPLTPIPQLLYATGLTDHSDLLVGMFGPGPTVLGRYGLVPGRLNFEAGVQTFLLPAFVLAPVAELQIDVPIGPLTLHVVPAIQPEFGARQDLTAFGLVGLEWPFCEHWDVSASLKTTLSSAAAMDVSPAAGLRYTLDEHWAVEAVGVMQMGAPVALAFAGWRY